MDATFILVLVIGIQSIIIAIAFMAVPFLFWQYIKLRRDVDTLDEVVDGILKAAGLKPEEGEKR